jgi:hypothetical protein
MAEDDPWKAHISYLEEEVKKIGERVARLEAMLPNLEDEQKKNAVRELVSHLRDELNEHRKYLSVMKPRRPPAPTS